jgi:hypothetical protein
MKTGLVLIGKEYVKFEREMRAVVYGISVLGRVLYSGFGSMKVKRLVLSSSIVL